MLRHTNVEKSDGADLQYGVALKPVVRRSFAEFCESAKATDAERRELESHLYLTRLRGRLAI